MSVVTRFAPSPTGFLHIGGARTALFSYLYAKRFGGKYLLRIEDTDRERSTQAAVDAIFEGMQWLGLASDFPEIYQTQRFDRYAEVIQQMLAAGTAYHCYASKEELDQMRAEQQARKEKPRYDGRWRPEPGKVLPPIPEGVKPTVRFKNPQEGEVVLNDLIKGKIVFSSDELDDLIIARADGVPTYNFCVVVDDMDMGITHVIRGDDHVNNTPRQINILRALGQEPPVYAHLPTVMTETVDEHGEKHVSKMSKRHGAKAVTQYRDEGYLADAIVNYLARLGWSHGDDEIFSRAQFIEWFNLDHLGRSASQFDEAKLRWVAQQHMKTADDAMLAGLVREQFASRGVSLPASLGAGQGDARLAAMCALFKDRCATTVELADWLAMYVAEVTPPEQELAEKLTDAVKPAVAGLAARLASCAWEPAAIAQAMKDTLTEFGLKMPQLAIPVRLLVCGRSQTPSVDAVLSLFERDAVLQRLR